MKRLKRLKRCPFCGGKAERISNGVERAGTLVHFVACAYCGCRTERRLSEAIADIDWNRRVKNIDWNRRVKQEAV